MGGKIFDGIAGGVLGGSMGASIGLAAPLLKGVADGGVGGILNTILGGPKGNEGFGTLALAISELQKLNIPEEEALKVILENPKLVGELVPALEGQLPQLQESAMQAIELAPKLQTMTDTAIDQVGQRLEGGLTDADRAELDQISRASRAQAQGQDARLLQNLAERGVLGGGQEILLRQAAAQQAMQAGAENAQNVARQAQSNRDAAIQQASALRQQSFGEESQKAQAADIINRFNLENQIGAKTRDTERLNQAQAANLAAKQAIENQRATTRNEQEMYNKQVPIQKYNMELGKAQSIAGALTGQAQAEMAGADRKQSGINSILGGGAKVAGAAMGAPSDARIKESIEIADKDIDFMLDELTPYKFKYKGGDQKQIGIMAQDLEKNPLTQALVSENENGVKIVDGAKAATLSLASLSHIHDRLKKLEKLMGA
jgi:hypothetical protein